MNSVVKKSIVAVTGALALVVAGGSWWELRTCLH